MSWAKSAETEKQPQKLEYPYNKQVSFLNIVPNTSRDLVLLTGNLDPTKTWDSPVTRWVHSWKSQRNGIVTYVSMNYVYACPIAFENEVFKVQNPGYKEKGLKLPYPLTKKVLCPVWDVTLGKVAFLLAGREIEQQMDFLLQSNPAGFTGFVRISRMGEGLNTKYRLDAVQPFDYPVDEVARQMIPLPELDTNISVDEFRTKTGIDPMVFWQVTDQKLKENLIPPIDTTRWGVRFGSSMIQRTAPDPPVVTYPVQTPTTSVAPPPPPVAPTAPPVPSVDVAGMTFDQLIGVTCSSGMFKGKSIGEAYKKSGLPVLQFLSRGGSPTEQEVAKRLSAEFESQLAMFVRGEAF